MPGGPSAGAADVTPSFGTFGEKRGSGLARGKRPAVTTAPAAGSAVSGYQPSTIAVIKTKSEYVNPFTGETSVPSPARPEPIERVVNEPAPAATPVRAAVPPTPAPVAVTPAVTAPIATPPARPAAPSAPREEKARLNILPPEENRRSAQSWERSGSEQGTRPYRDEPRRDRPDARPTFRPAGHTDAPRDERRPAAAVKLPNSAPDTTPAPKSEGFFGWLKSLFGGSPKPAARSSDHGDSSRHGSSSDSTRHEGGERRRRRRGGRGRSRREGGQGGESHEGHRHHHGENGHHRHHRSGGERPHGHHRHQGGGESSGGPAAS